MNLNNNIKSRTLLESCYLFKNIDDDDLETITNASSFHKLQKGEALFIQDEDAKVFYVIANGWVRLFRNTIEGEEAIIDILSHGKIIGDDAALGKEEYTYSAQAVEESEVMCIPSYIIKAMVDNKSAFAKKYIKYLANDKIKKEKDIEHRSLQTADQRIGCFLLSVCGDASVNQDICFKLPYDKAIIANYLGMKPETFSRAFAKLKSKTGVSVKGVNVEITDVEQLTSHVCNACSYVYPCDKHSYL